MNTNWIIDDTDSYTIASRVSYYYKWMNDIVANN
jgi:hypothetical protein